MSMTDLADNVGLTVTPCIERVKRLERDGVITGYYARVAPAALDAGLLVFVEISMSSKSIVPLTISEGKYSAYPKCRNAILYRAISITWSRRASRKSANIAVCWAIFCCACRG